MSNLDLKKGDWVIGWHDSSTKELYHCRPWQVEQVINNRYVEPLGEPSYNTNISIIKKLSNQEVLSWVDEFYPEGCTYSGIGLTLEECHVEKNCNATFLHNNNNKCIDIGQGYVYYHGMWAELISKADFKIDNDNDIDTIQTLQF